MTLLQAEKIIYAEEFKKNDIINNYYLPSGVAKVISLYVPIPAVFLADILAEYIDVLLRFLMMNIPPLLSPLILIISLRKVPLLAQYSKLYPTTLPFVLVQFTPPHSIL